MPNRARRTADREIDDRIIRMRTEGQTLAAIRKATGAGPERVRRVLADWIEATIDPGLRREVFVATVRGLEELIRALWPRLTGMFRARSRSTG